jgi:hypothetical protein
MPSRSMTNHVPSQFTATATRGGLEFSVALTQQATARHASGTVHVTDTASHAEYDAVELGTIQTAPQWATVTGRLRQRDSGAEHAFTLVVDRADPTAPGADTILLFIDGELRQPAVK